MASCMGDMLTWTSDGAAPDDWKKSLKIPTKDTRHQTEVCGFGVLWLYLTNKVRRMLQLLKASNLRISRSSETF